MESYIIEFEKLAWQPLSPGARQKAFAQDNNTIRLIEFSEKFIEPNWCEKSHIGFVLEGEMELNINGVIKRVKAGDGLFIPKGPRHRHKHHATLKTTRLILIESD